MTRKSFLKLGAVQFEVDEEQSRLSCTIGKNHPVGEDIDDKPVWVLSVETRPKTLELRSTTSSPNRREWAPSFTGFLLNCRPPNWTALADSRFVIGDHGEGGRSNFYLEEHDDVSDCILSFDRRHGDEFDVKVNGLTNAAKRVTSAGLRWGEWTIFTCKFRVKFRQAVVYVRAPVDDPKVAALTRVQRGLPDAAFTVETVRNLKNERGETFGNAVWLRPIA